MIDAKDIDLKTIDLERCVPKTDKFDYVTKSMIFSYFFCPVQFKKQYIDKIKQKPTYQMMVGTRVHDYYDTFFKNIDKFDISQWNDTIPDDFNEPEREMAEFFLDFERKRYEELDYELFKPYSTELWCQSEKYHIRGFIDRIDWLNKDENELMLVEYKTGKSFKAPQLRQELAFYSILFNDVTDNQFNITHTACFNPNARRYEKWPLHKRDLTNTIKKWNKLLIAIENNVYEEKCSDFKRLFCNRCD